MFYFISCYHFKIIYKFSLLLCRYNLITFGLLALLVRLLLPTLTRLPADAVLQLIFVDTLLECECLLFVRFTALAL